MGNHPKFSQISTNNCPSKDLVLTAQLAQLSCCGVYRVLTWHEVNITQIIQVNRLFRVKLYNFLFKNGKKWPFWGYFQAIFSPNSVKIICAESSYRSILFLYIFMYLNSYVDLQSYDPGSWKLFCTLQTFCGKSHIFVFVCNSYKYSNLKKV